MFIVILSFFSYVIYIMYSNLVYDITIEVNQMIKSGDYDFNNNYFIKKNEKVLFKLPIIIERARWVDLYNGMHFDY